MKKLSLTILLSTILLLTITLLSEPLIVFADPIDLSWQTINEQLVTETSSGKKADLTAFIIEVQPCTDGKIPKIVINYTKRFAGTSTKIQRGVSFQPDPGFNGDASSLREALPSSLTHTSLLITLDNVKRRYCKANGATTGDPKPAFRVRLSTQSESEAVVIGEVLPISAPPLTPPSTPPSTPGTPSVTSGTLRSCPAKNSSDTPFNVGIADGCDQAFNFGELTSNEFCIAVNAPNAFTGSDKQNWVNGCYDGYTSGEGNYNYNLSQWPISSINTDTICKNLGGYTSLSANFQKNNFLTGCVRGYNYAINRLSGPVSASFDSAGQNWCSSVSSGQQNQLNGCIGGVSKAIDDYNLAMNPGTTVSSPDPGTTVESADPGTTVESDDCGDPGEVDSVCDILKILDRIINWMFTIFIGAAVIFILLAAFKYLTAGGGEETAKAHKMLLYSAVAIAVAILAKGIVKVIQTIVSV